jgi:hypothetical protein
MFQTLKQIALNFFHRKALVAHSFPSVTRPLATFKKNYLLRDTFQVILVLVAPLFSFYHVWGLRKRAVTHIHTHTDGIRIIYIYRFLIILKRSEILWIGVGKK